VTDEKLSPTHAWRHIFKQIAERVGITEKVHDAITGHALAIKKLSIVDLFPTRAGICRSRPENSTPNPLLASRSREAGWETTEGRKYGPPTIEDMAKALKKFPRYSLD
jgi:hypothetical protein